MNRWMAHLLTLRPVAIITTGRTGSDFLQSLLDGHPQVLTFNGAFMFYVDFVARSLTLRHPDPCAEDAIDEFIGHYIDRLRSRYDVAERKDALGDGSQALSLSIQAFRGYALDLLSDEPVTPKLALLAMYGAYHLSLGRDLSATSILLHHAHRVDELQGFMRDFPHPRVLVTVRDPRASFVAGIEHGWEQFPHRDTQQHLASYLRALLEDVEPVKRLGLTYLTVRLEDLPSEGTMRQLASRLGLDYEPSLLASTWGGLRWYGDRLSPKPIQSLPWTPTRTANHWQTRLSRFDRYRLNALCLPLLRRHGYPRSPVYWWDQCAMPLLLCLPFGYEYRFWSWGYLKRSSWALRCRAAWYYLVRVRSCWSALAEASGRAETGVR